MKYFWADLSLEVRDAGCILGSEELIPVMVKDKLRTKRWTWGQKHTMASALNDQNDIREHKHPFLVTVLMFSAIYHSYRPLCDKWETDFSPATAKGCTNFVLFLYEGAFSRAKC